MKNIRAMDLNHSKPSPKYMIYLATSFISMYLFYFVHKFGVNIPWGDEWDALLFVDKTMSSGIDLSALFSQHNEHRIVITRIMMLANAGLFSLNLTYQMYFTVLSLIVVSLVCIHNHYKITGSCYKWLAVFAPMILCSFRQNENLLWGFQVGFVLSLVFSALMFHVLSQERSVALGILGSTVALTFGVLATLSSSQGLFCWPCALLLILLSGNRNRGVLFLLGSVGVVVWILYFWNYVKPTNHPSLNFVIEHPFEGFRFFCCLMGNFVAWREDVSFSVGAIFMGAFIAAIACSLIHNRLTELRFWITLGLFSCMVLLAITLGRAGGGLDAAFSSRYTTVSGIFLVSLVSILAGLSSVKQTASFRFALIPVVMVFMLAVPFSYIQGWNGGTFMKSEFSRLSFLLKNYRMVEAQSLKYLYIPNPSVIKERAPILEKLGHAIFK